jgi:hypothetical protein
MASQLRNKLTNTYCWLRNMLPYLAFFLILLCSCSVPGVDNQQLLIQVADHLVQAARVLRKFRSHKLCFRRLTRREQHRASLRYFGIRH